MRLAVRLHTAVVETLGFKKGNDIEIGVADRRE
jgi:antitoxin component of MazEF toxin-antitoxin module